MNRISNHPLHIKRFPQSVIRKAILRETIDFITLETGLFLEFGVYSGDSINYIANILPNKTIYGFDSWQGLPEDWQVPGKNFHPAGSYSAKGIIPKVPSNVKLVNGLFEDSLPTFVADHPNTPTAFVHIDSDLYSSAKTIFKYLGTTFVPGTVIQFDEYLQDAGEKQAFDEWLDSSNLFAVCIRTTGHNEQASFVITDCLTQLLPPVIPTWSVDYSPLIKHPKK